MPTSSPQHAGSPALGCLVLALWLLAPGPALAAQVVEFVDGRSMLVDHVVVDDELTTLELAGGGSLSVPSSRVRGWKRLLPRPAPMAVLSRPADDGAAWRHAAGRWAGLFEDAAARHGVDPALLTSMALAESALNPTAISPKGAVGLLQLMPATATRFGVENRRDPAQNVDGGARYLSWLLDRFDGRTELAVAGYNAGEGAVERHGGIPPYRETREYVQRVMTAVERFEGGGR